MTETAANGPRPAARASQAHFHVVREELLLRILRIVEAAGTALAFPSHTAYLAGSESARLPGAPRA